MPETTKYGQKFYQAEADAEQELLKIEKIRKRAELHDIAGCDAMWLIDRLGAAVSAAPQPRCPKCGSLDVDADVSLSQAEDYYLYVYCKTCEHSFPWQPSQYFKEFIAQFFAPAPAQEPPHEHDLACEMGHCPFSPQIKVEVIAPAQPVENSSRCRHCGFEIQLISELWTKVANDGVYCSKNLIPHQVGVYGFHEPISGGASTPLYSEQELKDQGLQASTINYGAEGSGTMYSKAARPPSLCPICRGELDRFLACKKCEPSAPKVEPLFGKCVKCGEEVQHSNHLNAKYPHTHEFQAATQATETASPFKHGGRPMTLREIEAAESAAPVAGTQPTPTGVPGDILEHEYRHEHGLLEPGECPKLCAAQGTPQVEEIARELAEAIRSWQGCLGYEDCTTPDDVYAMVLRKHLPGAPAQPGPEEKR